jgi:DNA gyrase subunit A
LLFFTDKGKVYGTKTWEIPETSRQAKGQALVNLLDLEQGEMVLSILPISSDDISKNLVMATQLGMVKKTKLSEFKNMRTSGLIAIKLKAKDSLVSVHETKGKDHILIVTNNGKSIRFPEANARTMGRATSGVRGIKLNTGDKVIGMNVFPEKLVKPSDKRVKIFRDLLTISEKGLGKRTGVHLFPIQRRSGKGVKAVQINQKTGSLACATMVDQKVELIVLTSKSGQVIKLPLKNIPQMGRATQGVILMRFARKNDRVAAVTTLSKNAA